MPVYVEAGPHRCGNSPFHIISSHVSCKRDPVKMRDYMNRTVTPPKRVTSPTHRPPPPCKQALNSSSLSELRLSRTIS